MKPIVIAWKDAASHDSWEPIEEAEKLNLHTIITMGFLVKEDESLYLVAMNWDRDGSVSQTIAIPKVWVLWTKLPRIKL